MHFSTVLATFLALLQLHTVRAALYFIQPASGSSCTGGSPCTLSWQDDGNTPLLAEIGVVTAGLYHGEQELVQAIEPQDVANVLSVQFTPNPAAGPNSGAYYIAFISTTDKVNGTAYAGFSPFFKLNGMSGSFASPLPSATSTFAIPTTISQSAGSILPTTITIGSVDTSIVTATASASKLKSSSSSFKSTLSSSSPSISGFTTSSIPASASTSVNPASAATTGSSTSSAPASHGLPSLLLLAIASLLSLLTVLS